MTEKEKQNHIYCFTVENMLNLNCISREGLYKTHKINKTNIFQKVLSLFHIHEKPGNLSE